MRAFVFPIDRYQAAWLFKPIRNKREALEVLLKTIKLMLVPTEVDLPSRAGTVSLVISKMNRLVYRSEKKAFSLAFPFHTRRVNNRLQFYSLLHPQIDSRCTSELLSLLENPELFTSNDVLKFADPICTACDIDVDLWNLFRDLLLLEDGYVRYDDDLANANGHRHPQHHIDLFYSQGTTFKAGLKTPITDEEFLDILNIETDCHYLQSAT